MKEKELKILLDKFLEGKTTHEEEKILSELEESSISRYQNEIFESDLEKQEIKQDIYSSLTGRIRKRRKQGFAMAASIALILALGTTLFYYQANAKPFIVSNTTDTIMLAHLTDGSVVTLNRKSKIEFKSNYKGMRYLELEGEAFFEIARDIKKPFVVKTGNLKTKVLGTSFNIKETDSLTNVTVATGLVEVSDGHNKIQLSPNQCTNYNRFSKAFKTGSLRHELSQSWFKETIHLEKIAMEDLAAFIQNNYGVKLEFLDEPTKKIQMSININKNEPLESILRKINYISELQLTKNQEDMMIHVKLKE